MELLFLPVRGEGPLDGLGVVSLAIILGVKFAYIAGDAVLGPTSHLEDALP